ncbi:hypothetical protein ACNKHX_05015 [Shigella flexneri]
MAARQASPVSHHRSVKSLIKAARTMALDVAGVDILRANRWAVGDGGECVAGLEGIEKTTGIDIAVKNYCWIQRHATTEYCLSRG